MKNLNKTILYSFCAALFLLTCSFLLIPSKNTSGYNKPKPKDGDGSGSSRTNAYVPSYTLGFSSPNTAHFQDSQCTSCSGITNNVLGDSFHSGNEKWIKIVPADNGYLTITGGTSTFDSVFYLTDASGNVITSGDDGWGSGYGTHNYLQPRVQYFVNAGITYYLAVDGTDKYGSPKNGSVLADFLLTSF